MLSWFRQPARSESGVGLREWSRSAAALVCEERRLFSAPILLVAPTQGYVENAPPVQVDPTLSILGHPARSADHQSGGSHDRRF
ncbi:MAG: hypothetical protein QM811_23225 [Pirellulales bacterium]